MASPSVTSRTVYPLASSIASKLRLISESVPRVSELVSRFRKDDSSSSSAGVVIVDSVGLSKSAPPPFPSAVAGANPRNYSAVGEILSTRHSTSFLGLGSSKTEIGSTVPFRRLDFSSRLHGWGAPPPRCALQFAAGAGGGSLDGGVGQQVRKIFVEVKGNNLDRAIRKWRRKCKEENLKALKDREYFRKPSEKRILALKERDRRIARRSFKMKLNWILSRRQRGF